jgi:formylglycine-generating enzyme required for sulfatase activity
MGKYPITQELYRFVMGENPSVFQHAVAGQTLSAQALERRPVDSVSWYAALVFCNRLSKLEGLEPVYTISGSTDPKDWGNIPTSNNAAWNAVTVNLAANGYRLPTEAEWEYACRAGTSTANNLGANCSCGATGWHSANSGFEQNRGSTQEVGGKPANAWGLFDMHGNVFEWVWDWYAPYELAAGGAEIIDPRGPRSSPPINRRVLRGGAWNKPAERFLRSAYRDWGEPHHACSEDGLRVARSVP